MKRCPITVCLLVAALGLAACGASGGHSGGGARSRSSAVAALPQAHPQAVQPTAGAHAATDDSAGVIVGDTSAHAPSLAQVKRELVQLNLCGGVTNANNATPVVADRHPGFVADPGTQQTEGELPLITAQLNALGKALGVTIYGISGYRTPAHSVASEATRTIRTPRAWPRTSASTACCARAPRRSPSPSWPGSASTGRLIPAMTRTTPRSTTSS